MWRIPRSNRCRIGDARTPARFSALGPFTLVLADGLPYEVFLDADASEQLGGLPNVTYDESGAPVVTEQAEEKGEVDE